MTALEEMMKKIERKPTFHERTKEIAKRAAASLLAPTILPLGMAAAGITLYGIPLAVGYMAAVGNQRYLGDDNIVIPTLATIASVIPCFWATKHIVWAVEDLSDKIERYK